MAHDADILIAGGGLNGLTLGLALAQGGMQVQVIDQLPAQTRADPEFDGRSYALALASKRMLGALGLWEGLAEHAQPILEVVASDGRAGEGPSPLFLHFDHAEIEEGPMGYMIEDRFLRNLLLEAAEATPDLTHRAGAQIIGQSIAPGAASVTLATGEVLAAPLLVGADGKASGTCARAGIGRDETDYEQDAIVCAVAHSAPHNGVAHQFFMPGGPLAILPLAGQRSGIVWSEERALAAEYMALDDAGFIEVLKPRFGSFLGEISLAGRRSSYPLVRSLARQIVAERVALVGDAAQAVHPIAGQGLNQGLRDVASLVQVVLEARRRGEDIGAADVLERHRAWRSFDRQSLAFATDGFNRLFSNDNPVLRAGRDLGMGLIGSVPGLRRRFIREAAGLAGDLPDLLRGRPI
ncbi:FAD-dependent monooxygenase [Harenicola maris]